MTEKKYILAYDKTLMRPACVLLQVVYGGTVPSLGFHFPSETWLVHPTPDMKSYTVTEEELPKIAAMSKRGR